DVVGDHLVCPLIVDTQAAKRYRTDNTLARIELENRTPGYLQINAIFPSATSANDTFGEVCVSRNLLATTTANPPCIHPTPAVPGAGCPYQSQIHTGEV